MNRTIACRIQEIRHKKLNRDLKLSKHKKPLDEFFKLALYTANNFEFPQTHLNYIRDHLLINSREIRETISDQLLDNWNGTKEAYDIELPLRAIEVVFTYGNFKLNEEEYAQLNTMLDSLNISLNI